MPKVQNEPPSAGYAGLALLLATVVLGGSLAFSQAPPPTPDAPKQETVVELRIRGHNRVAVEKIVRHIHTRANRPYEPDMVEEDVRRLHRTRMFTDVKASTQQVAGGRIVIFEVHERPVLDSVKYVGNQAIKRKTLVKESGLKGGDPVDPYAIEEGRRKIEEYYHTKGFPKAQVKLIEGSQPTDRRVIYLIDEGPKQRHLWTQFEGNSIANDSRLRTQIKAKPGVFWFIGGTVDPKEIDEDINRLTAYYRGLGFMQAEVGREFHWNEDHNWLTLTYVINEGIRSKVRNVTVIGNKKFPTEKLTADLKLTSGKFFNQAEMLADVARMNDIYGGEGYVFADVKPNPRYLETPGQLDLVYSIKEGSQYTIGKINVHIKGEPAHTKITTLLTRSSFQPGQIADTREFRASERRVGFSQIFAADKMKGDAPKLTYKNPNAEDPDTELAEDAPRGGGSRTARRGGGFRGQSPESDGADDDSSPRTVRFQNGYDPSGGFEVPQPQAAAGSTQQSLQSAAPGPDRRSPTGGFAAGMETPAVAPIYPSTAPAYPATVPSYPGAAPMNGVIPAAQAPPNAPAGTWTPQPGFNPQPNSQVFPASAPGPGPGLFQTQPGLDAMPPVGMQPFVEPPLNLDVDWNVAETATGRFMFSVGVNSDAGLVGSVVIDEQNFDWTRVPQSWEEVRNGEAFRGAGQRFRIAAMPGTQVQRYTVDFTEPYLFGTKVSLGLSGFYYDRIYTEWSERRIGGRIAVGRQFRPDLSGTISYTGQSIALFNPQVGISGTVPPEIQRAVGDHAAHSFRAQLTYDTRDNQFLATEGWLMDFGFEQTIGSFNYPRGDVDVRKYFLLHQRPDGSGRHVLSLGARMAITGDNTPVYENYFAGGFSTIRGFAFRDASPKDDGVFVGGHFMLLSSAEYMFPITADDTLRGVVFCDTGTVEPNINNWTDKYRVAPGLGLRITIPAMGPAPIALDFAFPVSHNPGDRQQVFSFFVGFLR